MSNFRSDPTANTAMGAVDREIRIMRKRAAQIAKLHRQGRLTPQMEDAARREFTGIYRRFLLDALGK